MLFLDSSILPLHNNVRRQLAAPAEAAPSPLERLLVEGGELEEEELEGGGKSPFED